MRTLALAVALLSGVAFAQASARAETTALPSGPTSGNDTAIWVHPVNVGSSLIFGTDIFGGGLYSWTMSGALKEFLAFGPTRSVDVRYGVQVGTAKVDVVLAVTIAGEIHLLTPNLTSGLLTPLELGGVSTGSSANAAALSFDRVENKLMVFVADTAGALRQFAAIDDGAGHLVPQLVRTATFDSPIEGIAADDRGGQLYLTLASRGLFALSSRSSGSNALAPIDSVDAGRLQGAAGVALYFTADGGGYVIASASQTSRFPVYGLGSGHPFVTSFTISADAGLEGATNTRGVELVAIPMGAPFSRGLFVAHDQNNFGGPNYKLVAWDDIATFAAPQLAIDTSLDPRGALSSDAGQGCVLIDGGSCSSGSGGGMGGGSGGVITRPPPNTGGSGGGGLEQQKPCGCGQAGVLFPLGALAWLMARRRTRPSSQ